MKLDELQREVERLTPAEQRKLMGFMVAMDIRRDEGYRQELSRRLDDAKRDNWISLKDAEDQLKSDGI